MLAHVKEVSEGDKYLNIVILRKYVSQKGEMELHENECHMSNMKA